MTHDDPNIFSSPNVTDILEDFEGEGGTMKIEIMLLVGSNGKSCACVRGDMGWGDLADGIMDYGDGKFGDPEFSDRYVVSIEVPAAKARKPTGAIVVTRVES